MRSVGRVRTRIGIIHSRTFASLLGPRGIRVNAVAPGVVETEMSSFTKTEAGRDFTLGIQALKRLAQPDDSGGAIAFLASDAALDRGRHMTSRRRLQVVRRTVARPI